MAASSSLSSQSWNHDVFLSFRGEDTRKTFVDHLYTALIQQGIHTYKDDETLPRGESIGPSLLKAIRESRITVIVFSENYADSSWCLDEVAYIMECGEKQGQIVMPVFYNVDPSDVRKQKGKYGEAFAKHELENNNKVDLWRKALEKAGNLSGWVPKDIANGHESKCIKEIVDTVSRRLLPVISGAEKNLIGIQARVQNLKSKLQIGSRGVLMIGIWGVGGGGKTTLASSVYDEFCRLFDGCCFIENIREESTSKNGLAKLQDKILCRVLKQKQEEIARVEEGKRMIKSRLCHKKVLIVLDDVDHLDHLNALAGSHDWFGEGSRIIITTRDNHLLNAHRVNVIHNITLLNDDEAIELFCKHAPRVYGHIEEYDTYSKHVVTYAGGLPLALKVLGSFLCYKNMNEWRSALARLKDIPETDILEKLKISYDGLKLVEKELLLDIACFFGGECLYREIMELDACGFHPVIGIKVLIQKALITISNGRFEMPDLIQEMAHYIVRGEHSNNPERHSRVWKEADVLKICDMGVTTDLDKIEAIRISSKKEGRFRGHSQVISKMKNLRWISWSSYCGSSLPTSFQPMKLSCLILENSKQKRLWKGSKDLPNLRMIVLQDCYKVTETPNFDGLPNLETFVLSGSRYLKKIHPSIDRLERLVCLHVASCGNLKKFPLITGIKTLKTLCIIRCPKLFKGLDILKHRHSINSRKEVACYKLVSTKGIGTRLTSYYRNLRGYTELNNQPDMVADDVECCLEEEPSLPLKIINHIGLKFSHSGLRELILYDCYLVNEDICSVEWELPNLQHLDLSNNMFTELNLNLLQLPQLKCLCVSFCKNLVKLSGLPSSIAVIKGVFCDSLETLGDISNCKWLWKVSLIRDRVLESIGGNIVLDSMLQGDAIEDHFISLFRSGYQIPREFDGMLVKGNKFALELPHNWYRDFCGFLICIMSKEHFHNISITIKQELKEVLNYNLWKESYFTGGRTYVGYVSFGSLGHTTWLNSAHDMISFSLDEVYMNLFGVGLVPRRSKGDTVQTTKVARDCSEFWDDEEENRYSNTFTIQDDSKSSIKILWKPNYMG